MASCGTQNTDYAGHKKCSKFLCCLTIYDEFKEVFYVHLHIKTLVIKKLNIYGTLKPAFQHQEHTHTHTLLICLTNLHH
jgi:hypothetical protein